MVLLSLFWLRRPYIELTATFCSAFHETVTVALTPKSFASAARAKAHRAQAKALAAEAELREANKTLKQAGSRQKPADIDLAVQRTTVAEEHVHEAVEELEVVKELLDQSVTAAAAPVDGIGASGLGADSAMERLRSAR